MKKLLFVYVVLYLTFICSLLLSYILFGKNAEIKSKSKIKIRVGIISRYWGGGGG